MDSEKTRELAEKIKKGTATQEEKLQLLKLINKGIEEVRGYVKDVTTEEKKAEIEKSL
jgi:hypothetical protein